MARGVIGNTPDFGSGILGSSPNGPAMITEKGIWTDESDEGHHFDVSLAKVLTIFFKYKTVVDFGCGRGQYIKMFNDHGIKCKGFDGNPHTSKYEFCEVVDLSQPVELGFFDWVLSLEVGEHIPQQYESVFLENIHKHNTKGVVISWAIPGQNGKGHVNCRTRPYIKQKFIEMGYCHDFALQNLFREHASASWLKRNIMVFTVR